MIKNLLWRGLPALALAALPLFTTAPASHALELESAATATIASPAVPGALGVRAPLSLFDAIDRIPVAEEHREGYVRTLYKHWNKGLTASDGCDTRKEVILAEALEAPQVAAGCKLTGGVWRSAYDDVVVTDAARLDVDHFVPLAEVFDSEQTPWSAARREAYANDQGSPETLIAVSAASNRSKADKDPAEWLPTDASYHCTYAATWVGTKLRWDLAVDEAERQALLGIAEDCPSTTVVYELAR
ncbi:HNH endonuclease family protein [Streptomyces sp. NBC_01443]|uniref:HNH endonuclease family protein n=1 Tax=Streptomyces sp. NBC_01443 TaxID=2903868 RepID=UPI002258325D|nr:HNH endonuclease family protein [Streptomyces sp. NBC_01443]MCX4632736.1 HNH endonuclease family protein [Streptomyces sp. NBC_01443]